MMYIATAYRRRPAIIDLKTRVYYFGFNSMEEARGAASILNKESK